MIKGTNAKMLLWLTLGAGGAVACGSQGPSPSPAWDCANVDVPNGTTTECTATNAAAFSDPLPTTYYCPPDRASYGCPSPDADAGATTPVDTSGGSGSGTGSGDTTVGTTGSSGSGSGGSDGGTTGCSWDVPCDDAGAPVGTTGGSGSGSGGSDTGGTDAGGGTTDDAGGAVGTSGGHGNGNGDHGNNGNGGNPHDDAGTSGGDTTGSGGGYTTGSGGGNGNGGGNGGGYTCDTTNGPPVCHKPPTCAPGTHASACGACVPDDTTEDCTPPDQGGCWVTGGGYILDGDGKDTFGGNAMPMKSGTIRGQWEHVDHGSGNKMHGEASYIYCRHVNEPGPGADNGPKHDFIINQVYFGGNARVFVSGAWFDGYWFDVMAEDHGEGKGAKAGGPDYYHVTIRKMSGANQSGTVVYDEENDMSGGNIQIHPPNNGHPYTSSGLPSWVSLQP